MTGPRPVALVTVVVGVGAGGVATPAVGATALLGVENASVPAVSTAAAASCRSLAVTRLDVVSVIRVDECPI